MTDVSYNVGIDSYLDLLNVPVIHSTLSVTLVIS